MKYVYKAIAAVLSIAVIPVAIFSPIVYYRVKSTALQLILALGQYLGSESISNFLADKASVPDTVADTLSIYDLFDSEGLIRSLLKNESLSETVSDYKTPFITAGIILALIAICAVVTAILAIVCKDNRKAVYSAFSGIGLSVAFKFAFESIAAPILDGKLTSSSLFGSLIASIEEFDLSSAFWFIPAMFAAVIVWTLLYNITLPEDEKRKRKIMLGEDEAHL